MARAKPTNPDDLDSRMFIRPRELARMVGLSDSEIYNRLYDGTLPARRYRDRIWLIGVDDARAFIEKHAPAA